jgi:lauroyl/myristoyl acyltransferase
MKLNDLANAAPVTRAAIAAARFLPPAWVYALADAAARLAARNPDSDLVRAVLSNQAVVRELPWDSPALDAAVLEVLHSAMRGHADVFQAMADGKRALMEEMVLDDSLKRLLDEGLRRGRGVILTSGHLSAYEYTLLTIAHHGYPGLALSYADPTGSYRVQNEIRRQHGLEVAPVSVATLRLAVRRLQQGGLVMTAIDRPDPRGELLTFFGRPARLPVGLARLAVKTDAAIVVAAAYSEGDHHYRTDGVDMLEPRARGHDPEAVLALAQDCLDRLEPYVRARPGEWLMFFPVWPDAMPHQALTPTSTRRH